MKFTNRSLLTGWGSSVLLLASTGCSDIEELPVYQAVPVTTRDIVVSASAAGNIEPVRTVDVKSKASGEIMEVRVETGDVVQKGDLLIRVDPRQPGNAVMQAEADLEVAQAQLANAQAQLRRSEALYETQSITEQEYENARLQTANANAQLVRARRALEDSRIQFEDTDVRAPINGVIIAKNVEVGTVISSATREVGQGTVLLQMADLDTVQVRSLVDETDIGKIRPEMSVTITVDAYPNRPFEGQVLKIEPQATVQQNVTMFPVLIRIANPNGLLRPGMNSEVEMHVGSRQGILAVPNAALRTERDVESAANVLGLDMETVQEQLQAARDAARDGVATAAAEEDGTAGDGHSDTGESSSGTINLGGREVRLPPGVTGEQVREIFGKMRNGGGLQVLNSEERRILGRLRQINDPGGRGRRQRRESMDFQFGGRYIVFALRDGIPTAVPIRTGLTDLDYSEITAGLSEADTVLILPSASLIASQRAWQDRIDRISGRSLPGVRRQQSSSSRRGGS